MIGLTDYQLGVVIDAARCCRSRSATCTCQRISAMLTVRGRGHFTDSDVMEVAQPALTGLAHLGMTVENV